MIICRPPRVLIPEAGRVEAASAGETNLEDHVTVRVGPKGS